jgi:hypothetical protein
MTLPIKNPHINCLGLLLFVIDGGLGSFIAGSFEDGSWLLLSGFLSNVFFVGKVVWVTIGPLIYFSTGSLKLGLLLGLSTDFLIASPLIRSLELAELAAYVIRKSGGFVDVVGFIVVGSLGFTGWMEGLIILVGDLMSTYIFVTGLLALVSIMVLLLGDCIPVPGLSILSGCGCSNCLAIGDLLPMPMLLNKLGSLF